MALLDKFKELFSKEAQKFVYAPIARSHVKDPNYSDDALESGKYYFRLWLVEMFLEKDIDWGRSWYPMAHSLVVFQFGQQIVEVPHVAGAPKLQGLTDSDLQSFIRLNYPMTALMPFNGGVVEMVTALVAMKGSDSVASVIKVMGDISKMLVVPQLSAALGAALPIANGVQNLIGGADGKIHLGVHQSFTDKGGGGANLLRPGYVAVVRGAERDYPPAKLWVETDQLRFGDSAESSQPLTGVTYILFRIEGRPDRDDWHGLKDIDEAFKEALRHLGDNDEEKGKSAYNKAAALARMSPDLTRADRNRVAIALKEEFEEARSAGLAAVPVGERSLKSVMERRAVDVEDALDYETSLEALLAR